MRKTILILISILLVITNCYAQIISKIKDEQIYKTVIGKGNDELIIGNIESPNTFIPQITFTKWNKENSLWIKPSLALASELSSAVTSFIDNKIEHKNAKIGWYANRDPDNEDNFKFGIILYEKPAANVFQFQLEGWKNFDFFLQSPLKNENPDGSTWEDNGLGGISKRPIDVNGSYAVYHKTKANHIVGQTNYETGKFCHIYRPKFIDANGDMVWVDLKIIGGDYIITIPQEFLNTAKYPIKANDTFGYNTIGASSDTNANIQILCKSTSTPGSSGTLTSVTFHARIYSTGSPELNPALYSDVSGTPTARLAYLNSGGTVCGANYAWVTTNLSYGSIASGTQYWIGMKSGVDGVNYEVHYDSGIDETSYNTNSTWGDPFSIQGTISQRRSIYATFTPSGGAERRIIFIQ